MQLWNAGHMTSSRDNTLSMCYFVLCSNSKWQWAIPGKECRSMEDILCPSHVSLWSSHQWHKGNLGCFRRMPEIVSCFAKWLLVPVNLAIAHVHCSTPNFGFISGCRPCKRSTRHCSRLAVARIRLCDRVAWCWSLGRRLSKSWRKHRKRRGTLSQMRKTVL